MKKKYIIVIVDDHKLFRDGIELLLNQFDFIDTVYQVSDGNEYLKLLSIITPDIVLMDINMPGLDGVKTTKKSKKINPNIKIVALTMHDNANYYNKMINAGADGFITKDTASDELKLALLKIINKECYISQKVLENVIKNLNKSEEDNEIVFSKREEEVLFHLAQGASTQEIAEKLYISTRTVERHKENMYIKTNCKNAVCLIMFAVKQKLIAV